MELLAGMWEWGYQGLNVELNPYSHLQFQRQWLWQMEGLKYELHFIIMEMVLKRHLFKRKFDIISINCRSSQMNKKIQSFYTVLLCKRVLTFKIFGLLKWLLVRYTQYLCNTIQKFCYVFFFKFRFGLEYVCTKRQKPSRILALLYLILKYATVNFSKKAPHFLE